MNTFFTLVIVFTSSTFGHTSYVEKFDTMSDCIHFVMSEQLEDTKNISYSCEKMK